MQHKVGSAAILQRGCWPICADLRFCSIDTVSKLLPDIGNRVLQIYTVHAGYSDHDPSSHTEENRSTNVQLGSCGFVNQDVLKMA